MEQLTYLTVFWFWQEHKYVKKQKIKSFLVKNVADIFKWQGKNIDKQNEAFLWRLLIVIVFAIVLLNLYLRQRLKINKELKKLEGEREFYNSIFLEEDSFYIHIDEQYYISQIEKLIEISGVTGEYVKPMELYAILSVKYTEIEQDEYERIILLFEKFRFMGYTKNKLVIW